VPLARCVVTRFEGTQMDNLLNLEHTRTSVLIKQCWTKADWVRPRLSWKPNGEAISVQLHKCFTHVTRPPRTWKCPRVCAR